MLEKGFNHAADLLLKPLNTRESILVDRVCFAWLVANYPIQVWVVEIGQREGKKDVRLTLLVETSAELLHKVLEIRMGSWLSLEGSLNQLFRVGIVFVLKISGKICDALACFELNLLVLA